MAWLYSDIPKWSYGYFSSMLSQAADGHLTQGQKAPFRTVTSFLFIGDKIIGRVNLFGVSIE